MKVLVVCENFPEALQVRLSNLAGVHPAKRILDVFEFFLVGYRPKLTAEIARKRKLQITNSIEYHKPERLVTVGRVASDIYHNVPFSCRQASCGVVRHNHYKWFRWERTQVSYGPLLVASSPYPGSISDYWKVPEARALGEWFWQYLVYGVEHDR